MHLPCIKSFSNIVQSFQLNFNRYLMTFRSEQVLHYQLLFPSQISWQVVNELGRLDCVHLEDNSDPIDNPFHRQVKRCDEALQKIQSMVSFMKGKGEVHKVHQPQLDSEFMEKLMLQWEDSNGQEKDPTQKISGMEEKVEHAWKTYQELTGRLDKLTATINLNQGKIAVFAAASKILGKNYFGAGQRENKMKYDDEIESKPEGNSFNGLSYFVSIVKPEEQQRISKMIFRVSKGYAIPNFVQKSMLDSIPQLDGFGDSVLFVFYPQSSQGVMTKKLQRLIQSFSNQTFSLPNTETEFLKTKASLHKQYKQSKQLLKFIHKEIDTFLNSIKSIDHLDSWNVFFLKEKALFQALNCMQTKQKFTICKFYIPKSKLHKLDPITKMTPTPILNQLPLKKPPSSFKSNLFVNPGQQIVQTYGIPRYGEINPGIFTYITFPFLFGVMFGDIAHGLVLFSFGLFLIFGAEKLRGGAFNMLLEIRYMVALMGFFAFYCGWIYNDFMGLGLNIFGSCYDVPMYGPGQPDHKLYPRQEGCVYPIGVDPVWYRAQNQLAFINSLKMKLSVIIGVIHMTFGIVLKAVNSIHFKKFLDLYFEFIPQIIFMVLLFGYMDFLIIFKWLKPWPEQDSWKAPSIITTLINLPLKLGKTTDQLGGMNMWGNSPTDTSQNIIQFGILLISVLCIPIMLIPKPWIQISKMNKKHNEVRLSVVQQSLTDMKSSQIEDSFLEPEQEKKQQPQPQQQQHTDKGQIIVHQIIQTIQFILGCISNTASYLRLWALSLAHSQLSRVFFQKTIQSGFQNGYSGLIMLVLGFYLLAYVTFGVLMCMDTMECFLHSLRLHWVEFQNKFFKADGIKFNQYSFRRIVEKAKEDN